MKLTLAVFVACLATLAFAGARSGGEEAIDYQFREAPINALGISGMADLRGKPVLIDFWGKN